MFDKLSINFETGEVLVNENGTNVSINSRVLSSASAVTYKQLSLLDVNVSLKAQIIDERLSICIYPIDGLNSSEMDKAAYAIASAINFVSPQAVLPQCYVRFLWGEILLKTEWRDGGWGADIQYF